MKKTVLFYFALILCCSGCLEQYVWVTSPEIASVENEIYYMSLKPKTIDNYSKGFESFELSIKNKSDQDIELIWDKTMYINEDQTSGGFLFEGVVYKDRNDPKSPDIIFAESLFSKKIWPNNLVSFSSSRYGGWDHADIPPGENGAYITIKANGNEYREKLILNFEKLRIEK